jgi:putative tricarboxylic transport membrane protein
MSALHQKEKEIVMTKKGLFISSVVVFSLLAIPWCVTPQAQAAYPEPDKLIDMYHHSAAGGAADLFVRTAADALNKNGIVKTKIQVQMRPGGSSAVSGNYLKAKAGDPYVMMHWTTANLMASIRGTTQLKLEDCVWLGTQVKDPSVLIVPYNSPYKTLKDLLADAKANPKKVSVGINSVGGSEHIQAVRIEKAAGVRFNATAFEFSPTQLIGGHISMAFGNVAETASHVKAKRARVLASVAPERIPYYKDIPTLIEQGVNASFTQYRGFVGGPGYPDEAIKFWDDAFAKLMKTKQFVEYMKKTDIIPAFKTAAETRALLAIYNKELEEDWKYMQANP